MLLVVDALESETMTCFTIKKKEKKSTLIKQVNLFLNNLEESRHIFQKATHF